MLAGSVVDSLAENFITTDGLDRHQHGVAPGHQKRDQREFGRIGLQHWRKKMPLHMVYAEHRDPPGERQAGRDAGANHQRTNQPRPGGVSDTGDFFCADLAALEYLLDKLWQLSYMVARGQFRHNATKFPVQVHLTVQKMRQQASLAVVQRNGGLIA